MKSIGVGFAIALSGFLGFSAAQAQAGVFASSPCDPNYYKSLEARAWLEAQREITQNQNLISKPDSVLEYTCFDGHLKEVAAHAKDMFSATTNWGTVPTNMAGTLGSLVGSALENYDNNNFNTAFLGGRATGLSKSFSANVSSGSYSCNLMQQVWMKAKCMNFNANPATDGFFTFADYQSSSDKRFPAGSCSGPGASTWQANIDEAIPPAAATTPWKADAAKTYYDRLFPTSTCGNPTNNKIMTGMLATQKKDPYFFHEHVCLAPGCIWVPTGTGTVTSPAANGSCQTAP
mgnify:CR=1 FL=1